MRRLLVSGAVFSGVALSTGLGAVAAAPAPGAPASETHTLTPIKHVIVIFQENVSFDHYFGTYPVAANTDGTHFAAREDTPTVNGLSPALLASNLNGVNPHRLSHSQPLTCDQNHDYTPEQQAFDHGLMDQFPAFTNTSSCSPPDVGLPNLVMDYYDGNTVTALWNYAQHFAMSDNSFSTTFGPSTPGALNLVAGQTHGATPSTMAGIVDNGTVFGDADPAFDDCSAGSTVALSGTNVGDLLNAAHVTWGWFQGGFRPTSITGGKAVCSASSVNLGGSTQKDYSAHHEPFQYFASTSNPHHTPPATDEEIGHNGPANHQYDLSDFFTALGDGHLPAVSFLKAARFQDGHAGYSDPLDEQRFLVGTINAIQRTDAWESTAVIIAYDDSDGWYDHVMPPIVNTSQSAEDALSATGKCGTAAPLNGFQDRCGYGPRQPLLVISPFARDNYVDHAITDQSSILRFIEDNWALPRIGGGSFDALAGSLRGMFDFGQGDDRHLILDPITGNPK